MDKFKAFLGKDIGTKKLLAPSFSFIMFSSLTLLTIVIVSTWDFIHTNHEQIRNIGLVCTALVGFPMLIWRTRIADKQTQVAHQQSLVSEASHLAETYTKAIEQLGATKEDGTPHIELRLGGLYSLEKIAQHNEGYHNQIMEVLCAYMRMHSPMPEVITSTQELNNKIQSGDLELKETNNSPRIDLQAAMTIIGRRRTKHDSRFFSLNLQSVNLRNFDLYGANLSRANLTNSDLSDTDLYHADLSMTVMFTANFQRSCLEYANFSEAKLRDATFNQAILSSANFSGANLVRAAMTDADLVDTKLVSANLRDASLVGAVLGGANLEGANLNRANLTEASLSGANLVNTNFRKANLTETDFSSAKTGNTNLEATKLIDAMFQGAQIDIQDTLLLGAEISGVIPPEAHNQLKEVQSYQEEDRATKNSMYGPSIKE